MCPRRTETIEELEDLDPIVGEAEKDSLKSEEVRETIVVGKISFYRREKIENVPGSEASGNAT